MNRQEAQTLVGTLTDEQVISLALMLEALRQNREPAAHTPHQD